MKAVIFAGGVGTRLWPLSRRNSPKQFEKVIGDKSTLQLAAERLTPDFIWNDIYIATSERYKKIVREQLPLLPDSNIIIEPETRDVGPAVGLVMAHLVKKFPNTPTVILWSDHLVKHVELFKSSLKTCSKIISEHNEKIIFISQKPRFASQNLGWIKYGLRSFQKDGLDFNSFCSFIYRPSLSKAELFFRNGNYSWNVGYFVSTPKFLWSLYYKHQPEIFCLLEKIKEKIGTTSYVSTLIKNYKLLPKISFDNAILEKIVPEDAFVLSADLGWSDVGAWEALKEALQASPEQNVIQGKVLVTDCKDSLIYNYTNKMVVTIDIDGLLVINTNDVLLICHKNSVPKIKKLVESLAGSENEHLV